MPATLHASFAVFSPTRKCPFGGDAGGKGKKPADAFDSVSDDSQDEESLSEPESEVELDMEGKCRTWFNVKAKTPQAGWPCNFCQVTWLSCKGHT